MTRFAADSAEAKDRESTGGARVPRRVWSSTGLLLLSRAFSAIAGLAGLALLTRTLEDAELGRLTFWLAAWIVVDTLVDFGTSSVALQRGAHDPAALARAIATSRRVRMASATAAAAVVTAGAVIAGERDAAWIAAAALLWFTRPLEATAIVLSSAIDWRAPVVVRVGIAASRLAAVVALAGSGVASFGAYLFAHAAAGGLGNVALHFVARSRLRSSPEHAADEPRPSAATAPGPSAATLGFARAAAPLALAAVCQQAYFYADNVVVRAYHGAAELATYNVAVRVLSTGVLVAGFATGAALPWLVREHRAGRLVRATTRLTAPLVLASLVGTALVFPFVEALLRLAFGEAFVAAAPSLRWLLAAAVAIHLGAGPLTAVVASGRSRAFLAIAASSLIFNVVSNLILVPELASEGAAAATFATELFVAFASIGVLAAPRRPFRPEGIGADAAVSRDPEPSVE